MEYTLEELKAAAYDHLVEIERLQIRLNEINLAIKNYAPKVEEDKLSE